MVPYCLVVEGMKELRKLENTIPIWGEAFMGWNVSLERYIQVVTPSTSECNLIWEQGLRRDN